MSRGELDHGAVDQLDRDRAAGARCAGPHSSPRRSCRNGRRRPRGAPSSGDSFNSMRVEKASVPSEPTSICARLMSLLAGHQRVEIVAADAALHLGKARGDLVGLARADGEQVLGERPQRRRHVVEVAADAAEMRERAVGQHRVDRRSRCRAWCRSACERPPQELLPAMPPMVAREAVEMSTGNHRPCGLSWRLRSSSTMPGSTVQRARLTSRSRMRVRYFEQSTTSASPTVCPACEVPPPRASTLTPSARAMPIARSASSIVRGATTPTGMIW